MFWADHHSFLGGLASRRPLPISYFQNWIQFAINQSIPDPDQKYQCFGIGAPLELTFGIGTDGVIRFDGATTRTDKVSFRAERDFGLGPFTVPEDVTVDVVLEALVPRTATVSASPMRTEPSACGCS